MRKIFRMIMSLVIVSMLSSCTLNESNDDKRVGYHVIYVNDQRTTD